MKKLLLLLLVFIFLGSLMAQDHPAYQLYNKEGKKVKFSKMLEELGKTQVVFFGEIHNDPIVHWLQLEFSKALMEAQKGQLVLGAEMFESDNQLLLEEYLSEAISEKNFEDEARLWTNYSTDYKPLVLLAKRNQVDFIATNIPRRYANMVFKQGIESLETLSEEAKSYIAPMPIEVDLELEGYKGMLEMMEGHGGGNENFPMAQAIKDATMAWFIHKNIKPDYLFIHYNGSFHSENYEGIYWYLQKYQPGISAITIHSVSQEDINELSEDNRGRADFTICVPENMCKTH